jgi:PAS domain S-box-containing protein
VDDIASLLGRNGFLPHGYCFTWQPGLLWTMVAADATIAAAYFTIPAAMLAFMRKRPDVSLRGLLALFSVFIFACGVTHLADIWVIWQPDYAPQAVAKVVTAAASAATAVVLWRLLPQALRIPSVGQLQAAVQRLEAEVAQRRSAEDQLADVRQSLAVTLASIGAGFIATDRQGRVVRMNKVAEQLLGWAEAEAAGLSLWQVFQRDDRPQESLSRNPVDLMIEQALTIDTVHHVTAIARSGRRTPVEVKAALTRADDGSVRGLAMVLRDLTVTQRAEETSARLAAIVESSGDAIIGKTLDGTITSWNRAAQQMFGYSADEAIGQSVQLLIPAERQPEEMDILARLSRGEVVPPFETQRRRRDGRLVDVSLSISPIRDAQGRLVGAAKIVRDIAPLKQAQEARLLAQRLEAENRQILEANRLKGQFLANMSHELRTPLNAIIGFGDLLHRGVVKPESPKHHEYLGHIATSGRHLLQLINDVLDLSKVESGKFEFFPEPVELPGLVAEVIGVLQGAAQRKRIETVVDIDPALGTLVLDPVRLKQALYNYLSNAIKFTPENGRVSVSARPEGERHFRLEVADSGIGIALADQGRLFGEFLQLDAGYSKRHQGTGLGLALTRRLVEAQGGSVGVRSTPGLGSVFHLVLAREQAAAVAPAPAEAARPRLLVIEGDAVHQSRLASALAEAGFAVDGVATGAQALLQMRGQAYGALALDLVLPDQGGLDVLAHIRSEGPSRASPVLGVCMPAEPGSAATFAVADVLFKPIRTAEVAAALARLRLSRTLRVLVVDDDPLARQLMQATLAGMGAVALCVEGGRQALAEVVRQPPDAMILDLMMPELDGFETLDLLRRLPEGAQLPVYIWTSMVLGQHEIERLSLSARAILGKGGGNLAPLLEAVRRWHPQETALPGET